MPVFSATGLRPFRRQQAAPLFCLIAAAISALVVVQDYLWSSAVQGSFYLSESFIFSGFWWLFPPLLLLQEKMQNRLAGPRAANFVLSILLPAGIHCLAYPLLTDSLGRIFLGHGFRWINSFQYGITEYLYVLVPTYIIPLIWKQRADRNTLIVPQIPKTALIDVPKPFLQGIIVSLGGEHLRIDTRDIRFFRSASPYVRLHTKDRQYLVQESLRHLSETLDPAIFVRIHKTVIVNTRFLTSVQSRQNGDYDLRLDDGTVLRLSRSYLADFRKCYAAATQVTV